MLVAKVARTSKARFNHHGMSVAGALIVAMSAAVVFFAVPATPSRSEDTGDIAEVMPTVPDNATVSEWAPVNQVLELPQACTKDGVVLSCDDRDASTGQVADTGNADEDDASIDHSATATGGAGENRTGLDDDGADDGLGPVGVPVGSVDDYQNQEIDEVPVFPAETRLLAGLAPAPSYVAPLSMPALRPIAPAWGPMPLTTSPWMMPSPLIRPASGLILMHTRGFPIR